MNRFSILLLGLFFIAACGEEQQKLNQGNTPKIPQQQQPPTQPQSPNNQPSAGAGTWTMPQMGALFAYCESAVGAEVLFCGCYGTRVTQMISYNDYNNNSDRFTQVHQQLETDNGLTQCLTGQGNTNSARNYLTLLR